MPTPNELRSALADLSTLAGRELDELWKSVTNADQAKAALLEVLPPLTYAYGLASGALAADWYDETRDELNVDGRFSAVVPEVDAEGTDILARWGVGPLFDAEPDWDAARTLVAGGVQYKIADVARKTVMGSTFDDPQARGWQRSASNGCDFCKCWRAAAPSTPAAPSTSQLTTTVGVSQ